MKIIATRSVFYLLFVLFHFGLNLEGVGAIQIVPVCTQPTMLTGLPTVVTSLSPTGRTLKNPVNLGTHVAYTYDDELRRFNVRVANLTNPSVFYDLPIDPNDSGHFYLTGIKRILAYTDGYYGYYNSDGTIRWPRLVIADLGIRLDQHPGAANLFEIELFEPGHHAPLLLNNLRVFLKTEPEFETYTVSWRVRGWEVRFHKNRFCTIKVRRSDGVRVQHTCMASGQDAVELPGHSNFSTTVTDSSLQNGWNQALNYKSYQYLTKATFPNPTLSFRSAQVFQGNRLTESVLWDESLAWKPDFNTASFRYLGSTEQGKLTTFASYGDGLHLGFDAFEKGQIPRLKFISDPLVRDSALSQVPSTLFGVFQVHTGMAMTGWFDSNHDYIEDHLIFPVPNLNDPASRSIALQFFSDFKQSLVTRKTATYHTHGSDKTVASFITHHPSNPNLIEVMVGVSHPNSYFDSDIYQYQCQLTIQ